MTVLFVLLFIVTYAGTGLAIGRGQYAREVYRRSLLTKHTRNCDTVLYKYSSYPCDCVYSKKPAADEYMTIAAIWPFWTAYVLPKKFITTGKYEPKEVKAARRAEELDKVRQEFEQRTQALEEFTGIRKN